jgi:hypothetical protein
LGNSFQSTERPPHYFSQKKIITLVNCNISLLVKIGAEILVKIGAEIPFQINKYREHSNGSCKSLYLILKCCLPRIDRVQHERERKEIDHLQTGRQNHKKFIKSDCLFRYGHFRAFVFLLIGEYQYHIVMETLDTEEATYIWHVPKVLLN